MVTRALQSRVRKLTLLGVISVGVLALSACAGGGSAAAGKTNFDFLGLNGNTTVSGSLKSLSEGACAAEQKALPLKTSEGPVNNMDQKLQLLASQSALPALSAAFSSPSLMKDAIKAKTIENVDSILGSSAQDDVLPAARNLEEALYGGQYALPTELNIEGFFYNKKMFADNGIAEPKTWDDLLDASKKLQAAGIQPHASYLSTGGWPTTRLVGLYILRDLGKDALQKVADGKAKLTDPGYVKAADAVADLTKEGFFGSGTGTDGNTQTNEFLTGKAAMLYAGSWSVPQFNDPAQNKIGVDNIGYMGFPAVKGGAGSRDDVPANLGIPVMVPKMNGNAKIKDWVKCIAANYGDAALALNGQVSGFTVHKTPDNLTQTSKLVIDTVSNATSTVPWFEALFPAKAADVAGKNGTSLQNGSISGKDYMTLIQNAM